MRIKVDENLPAQVIDVFCAGGHDTVSVFDQDLQGGSDESLASVCRTEGRVLVSLDLDFADIRTYPPSDYAGLVVLRLARQDLDYVVGVVRRLASVLSTQSPEKKLWIVEENRIRERE